MGVIRNQAAALYVPGQKVSKAGSRSIMGTIEDQIASVGLGLIGFMTWAQLSAVTDAANHALAVVATSDLGQHTDPVSGETVDNAGYYRWNAEETGWEWLSLSSIAGGVEVSCEIVADGSTWTFTARPGQPPVHPSGLGQTYSGFIPTDADGFAARVIGVNDDDPRPAAFQHADYATTGALFDGEYVRIAFREGGQVQILNPSPLPPATGGGLAFLRMALIGRTGNNLHVEPVEAEHPNTTGDGYYCVLTLPADFEPDVGGWTIATAGITMDPIALTYVDGAEVEPGRPVGLNTLIWSRPGGSGTYKLYQLWQDDDAKPGGGASGSEYDRVLAAWANANARSALTLGRRNAAALAGNLTALGALTGAADTLAYFTGAAAMATTPLTSTARSLLDDTSTSAMRTTLGLGTIATQAASAVALTGGTAFGLGGLQVTGTTSPVAGSGLEIQGGSSVVFQAYNRTGGAYIPFNVDASQISLRPSGTLRLLINSTQVQVSGSLKLPSYTVATVPSASAHGAGSSIYVSDESGGTVVAYSDGTSWRRVTDRNIIS